MRHACDNLLTNLKPNPAQIFAADPWSMVIKHRLKCIMGEVDRVSGRSYALAVTTNILGLVFNVTPSGKNTYELNARFSQKKTSALLFHAIQIFYKNNAIWDMDGRQGSPFLVYTVVEIRGQLIQTIDNYGGRDF